MVGATTEYAEQHACRGRSATRPQEIPAKGWGDVLLRVKNELSEDKLTVIAAGVAFYALLAIFPALTALVSIYGLVADPADVQQQLNTLSGFIPAEAQTLLNDQLSSITAHSQTALGVGVIGSILLALWGATKGLKTLMEALNVVYDEKETRGFLKLNATALILTFGALMLGVIAIGLVVALPALLGNFGLGADVRTWVSLLRWPVLAFVAMLGLAVVYRYGPSRSQPRWHWVSWGAVLATVLWIAASVGFSYYVSNFSSYNETYGSLGGVVVFLMWLFITAFIILLGAELNAEMEHQTRADTTEGGYQPLGQRGAYVADTVGKSSGHDASSKPSADNHSSDRGGQRVETNSYEPAQPKSSGAGAGHRLMKSILPLLQLIWSIHQTERHLSRSTPWAGEREMRDYDHDWTRWSEIAKRHPVPVTLIGIGLAWFLFSHGSRSQSFTDEN
ncbi:YihY/virulence factor BrkB family protein [Nitrosococcus watsonii]|uniref:Ribonuclease BN n=1 Tax=Nitrosococcus watsoni (strain C-113) TaxID=105559 RepID=D8K6A8_NITWC|nr:YihY/virulence factor BrkB family protein [Nitrosococcus watsonii]ADJ28435.1 ribonuclease BN [Nitrosococcus watsonii C-113]